MNGKGFGWRPQTPDHRDLLFHLDERILKPHQLPQTGGVPRNMLPSIWNQGALGSCTAHGSLRAFMACAIQEGLHLPMLSRLMQYWDTRSLEGTTDTDSGGTVRDAIKALATFGVCPETEWPYDVAQFATAPPPQARADARQHMAIKYQSVIVGGPGAPMRTALAAGHTIVFGFSVPGTFEDGSWDPASERPLPLPGPDDGFIGGHCVACRAYDFTGRMSSGFGGTFRVPPYFTCQNSWGEEWGMAGEFNMDAAWFTPDYQLATDLWVIQKDS
jgi:C1A family cysteine protease